MPKKVISEQQAEAHRVAQAWAKEIHKSQIAKGLRPADGESEEEDIVENVKQVIVDLSEKTNESNFIYIDCINGEEKE